MKKSSPCVTMMTKQAMRIDSEVKDRAAAALSIFGVMGGATRVCNFFGGYSSCDDGFK